MFSIKPGQVPVISGKSAIIRQKCEELGVPYVDVPSVRIRREDLYGLIVQTEIKLENDCGE